MTKVKQLQISYFTKKTFKINRARRIESREKTIEYARGLDTTRRTREREPCSKCREPYKEKKGKGTWSPNLYEFSHLGLLEMKDFSPIYRLFKNPKVKIKK